MHDKRDERGGARNEQRELLNEVDGVSGAPMWYTVQHEDGNRRS